MLIYLPPLQGYSLADCQELFMSKVEEDFEINGCGAYRSGDGTRSTAHESNALSDAEPFLYTSSSDSDLDVSFSDIEDPSMGVPGGEKAKLRTHSVIPLHDNQAEHEISLHSPGKLLGTPRDSSRRYEYPFPVHLQMGESVIAQDAASSTATTPALTPAGEVSASSLGLLPLVAPSGMSSRSASLPLYMPTPAPAPVPVLNSRLTNISGTPLTPLSHAPAVSGPLSAPALSANPVAAHPKLSRFNPANAPIPPGLRGRTGKSASMSVPQALQPIRSAVASVSIPATIVGGS